MTALGNRLRAGNVIVVGTQTGFYLDDLGVLTDTGAYALFQAKVGLSLSAQPDSALAKALEQAVNKYLLGKVPAGHDGTRSFQAARDVLVLCTDAKAPVTVTEHLAEAFAKAGTQLAGADLEFDLNRNQRSALRVALAHVRRFWVADGKRDEPDDERLRDFVGCVRVLSLNLEDGRGDQMAAPRAAGRGTSEGR